MMIDSFPLSLALVLRSFFCFVLIVPAPGLIALAGHPTAARAPTHTQPLRPRLARQPLPVERTGIGCRHVGVIILYPP